jgi:gamma-glutamylcyclotransferase (GGCT)/AIG2-like uncharacterized protein YtfP
MTTRVFAYGSNLDAAQMSQRCPHAKLIGLAALKDHRLDFSRYSNKRKGGVADVIAHPGDDVWGVVYELNEDDLKTLDVYEGYKGQGKENVYDRRIMPMVLYPTGSAESVEIYVVREKASQTIPPHRDYLDIIIQGAEQCGLPDDYIAKLKQIPATA